MVSFPSDVGLSILKAWKRSEWQGAYNSPGRPGLGFRTALGQTWVFSDFGPLLSENPQHAATGRPVGNQLLISFFVSSTSTGQGRERGVEEDNMQCLKLEKCTLTLGQQSGCKELGLWHLSALGLNRLVTHGTPQSHPKPLLPLL